MINQFSLDFLEDFTKQNPVDTWYRKKFGIRFGSKEHRETSLKTILSEFYFYVQELKAKKEKEDLDKRQERFEKEEHYFYFKEIDELPKHLREAQKAVEDSAFDLLLKQQQKALEENKKKYGN